MKAFFYRLAMILMLLAINISIASAQTTGAIAGTATDQSGAVVPNAAVVVGNQTRIDTFDEETVSTSNPSAAESSGDGSVQITAIFI